MAKIEKSIDVNVPVREAYNQWTQFESFPQFMEGVESVRQQGDTNLHWVATIAGKRQEWDAEITEQTPDQRIAWTSTTGDRNAGAVDFHRVSDNQTRITLTMDIEPSGAVEAIGTALGIPSGQVEGDLKRFKEFIESRGSATGAWRGEVDQNDVTGTSGSSREMAAMHRVLRPAIARKTPARLRVDVIAVEADQCPLHCRDAQLVELRLRDAEVVEFAHGVGLQVDAHAQWLHLAYGFEHDTRHADLMKRQRGGQSADTATGDEDWTFSHESRGLACRNARVL